jgi:hypothetical protein
MVDSPDVAVLINDLGVKWRERGFKLWFERYDHGKMFALSLTRPDNGPTPYAAKLAMSSPPFPSCDEVRDLDNAIESAVFAEAGHG